jgi:archaellum component FlaC
MELIYQIGGAALALFFIFLTYMNTKSWRWVHVTAVFLVFAASVAFCFYAAQTLKTRAKWVKEHDDLEKRLVTTEEDLERTTRGDMKDVENKTPSVFSIREALARTTLDRGRVWRGCQVSVNRQALAANPPNLIVQVLTSQPPDPNNPSAPPPKKHNIQPKTIVHAFREVQLAQDGPLLPLSYIGEFRAMPVNDQTLTLEPTIPLAQDQIAAGGLVQGTWTLYETMPVDGHEWLTPEKDANGNPVVPSLLNYAAQNAAQERAPITPQILNQIAAAYLRDGEEIKDDANVPPENTWYEVKFDQEYEVTVDAPIVNSIDADPFNTEGQAILERLRRRGGEDAGKVKFGPKTEQINSAVLDQQTAQTLIDQKIATLVRKVYRRNLIDYEREFHAVNERTTEINGRLRQLDLDNKAMLSATQKAQEQQKLVEELQGKIKDDLGKVRYELAELEKYSAGLRNRLTTTQSELSQLYLSNKAISRELNRLTADLTEQIERRTREATARVP